MLPSLPLRRVVTPPLPSPAARSNAWRVGSLGARCAARGVGPGGSFGTLALTLAWALALALPSLSAHAADAPRQPPRTSADIIATAPADAWRDVAPENLLVMTLPQGQALIELAPRFAPRHVDNIRALARGGYWDGLAILRVQDNYVTQWGDPHADDEDLPASAEANKDAATPPAARPRPKPFPNGAATRVPAEFDVPLKGLPLTALPDVDGWAPRTGHVDGFPVAADPRRSRAWLAHCYASVGAGRGNAPDSSTGAELYVVIGHAPRGLDLNITLVGRVLKGMEWLSALPRGTGNMGFYDKPEQRVPITRIALAAALPAEERPQLQVLRTDTPTWQALLDARRHRGGWFVHSPGHTDVCSATAPSRPKPVDVKLNLPRAPITRQ